MVGVTALGVVARLDDQLVEVARKQLHHAAERPGTVVGRRRPAQDVDRADEQRIDKRRRHTGSPLPDNAHAGDQGAPAPRDAADGVGLEDAALTVFGTTGQPGDQLGQAGQRAASSGRITVAAIDTGA